MAATKRGLPVRKGIRINLGQACLFFALPFQSGLPLIVIFIGGLGLGVK